MLTSAFQVATTGVFKPEKPVRDPRYKRWVKSLPCAACGTTRLVDPCHTGAHGLSVKGCDLKCIPLCRRCHDAMDASPRSFTRQHHLNISRLIKSLHRLWQQKQRTNPS